jgi:ferrous iron transport protein B
MTSLKGYVLMVFVLLYIPCITTMAIVRRETNSWRWPLFTVAYVSALAYVLCFLIYQGGRILGIGV